MKSRDMPRLVISLMAALCIVRCMAPLVERVVRNICTRESAVTVTVLAANQQTGGSEVWFATLDGSVDLLGALEDNEAKGALEYRTAAEYGYGYDFLISYGDNLGSVLRLTSERGHITDETGLLAYKHPLGGLVELDYKNVTRQIDLYAQEPEVTAINLEVRTGALLQALVKIVAVVGLCALIYLVLPGLWKNTGEQGDEVASMDIHGRDGGVRPPSRNPSIDLARTTAAFLVVLVHSFLASGYYNAQLVGEKMLLLTFLRWIALDCVPLFMLITGYLCISRKDIAATYKSLVQPLLLFVLAMLAKLVLLDGVWLRSELTWDGFLRVLVQMDLAWYLRMYIGLVLLMPFLNRMWHGLERGEKRCVVTVSLVLTAGRSAVGGYFPGYWIAIYPITYYFLGAYFREEPISLPGWKTALLFLGVTLMETALTFAGDPTTFDWAMFGGYENDYPAFPVVVSAVLLFSLLSRVKIRNPLCQKFFALCGKNTLGVYLISVAITDNLVHPPLQRRFATPQDYMWVQLPAALVSFLLALALSALFTKIINHAQTILQRSGFRTQT